MASAHTCEGRIGPDRSTDRSSVPDSVRSTAHRQTSIKSVLKATTSSIRDLDPSNILCSFNRNGTHLLYTYYTHAYHHPPSTRSIVIAQDPVKDGRRIINVLLLLLSLYHVLLVNLPIQHKVEQRVRERLAAVAQQAQLGVVALAEGPDLDQAPSAAALSDGMLGSGGDQELCWGVGLGVWMWMCLSNAYLSL